MLVRLLGGVTMEKCFADNGRSCTALRIKNCEGCNFFKTLEQKIKDDEKTRKRLDSMKDKCINILF